VVNFSAIFLREHKGVWSTFQLANGHFSVITNNKAHPFLPNAIDALFTYSEGTPREACILADNSLLLAFLNNQQTIDRHTIETAAKERLTNIGVPRTRPQKQTDKK
jgi:hypothetical protein